MRRFLFGSEAHDKACREILRSSPMGKDIRLSFRREPSFFPAEKIANSWSRLVVLYDDEIDQILGFGVMAGRPYWLKGKEVELGYISQLRLTPEFQNGLYLAKGYRKFKELHDQDKKVPFYLTTVLSDNSIARNILESERVGLPLYRQLDEISSYFFLAKESKGADSKLTSSDDIPRILASYNEQVSCLDVATRYDMSTFSWLSLVDHMPISLQERDYEASGVLVDLSNVKQTFVDGYSTKYKAVTSFARLASPILNITKPPKAGDELKSLYLTATSFKGDKDAGFSDLIRQARNVAFQKKFHGIVLGLGSRSSFNSHSRGLAISDTKSVLYAVSWDENMLPKIDPNTSETCIEVATL